MKGLAVILALGLAAGAVRAQPVPDAELAISPVTANAGAHFDFSILSRRYWCATTFLPQGVEFVPGDARGGRINVTLGSYTNPLILCASDDRPYGPFLSMPPLPAGSHQVFVRTASCGSQPPYPCIPSTRWEAAGRVVVTDDGNPEEWVLAPLRVKAGQAFKLHLLSAYYGICHTDIAEAAGTVDNGRITLQFSLGHFPQRKCMSSIFETVDFTLPGLPPGSYPVHMKILERSALPQVGTLTVESPSWVSPGASRAGPRVFWSRGGLRMDWTGAGNPVTVRVDIHTLAGKRIHRQYLAAGESLAPLPAPRGVYQVRVEAAGRPRQDVRVIIP